MLTIVFILVFSKGLFAMSYSDSTTVTSPNGKLNFKFDITNDGKAAMSYQISFQNNPLILPSSLGLVVNPNGNSSMNWTDNLIIVRCTKSSKSGSWLSKYSELKTIPDNYNELTITLKSKDNRKKGEMQLMIRAYNEGVAFRYYFPEHLSTQILEIGGEKTQFNVPVGTNAFVTDRAQGRYNKLPIKDWKRDAELPLTMVSDDGQWFCIAQAAQVNYARMRLKTVAENSLMSQLFGDVVETSPFSTPWRVVMVGKSAGELLENNYLISNLNEPSQIANTNWIKPGKVMRETGLTTETAKKLVDFATEQNIDYIHFDAGWYGYEYDISSDASAVSDAKKSKLDIKEAVAYANKHGKKVILYVNHRALEKQADSLFPLYKSWGVAGIKFGFVHTGSQLWNRWLHETIKKAANYQLIVNVHDEYYPTGFSRTYPNLLTQEGVLGNEAFPDATHNTMLPFTRYIAGAADYTFCFNFHKLKNSKGHQLALPVIYFSPLQYLYWYGKPSDYTDRKEIEFWKDIPTTWDVTKVVAGAPGEYAAIARKKDNRWFLGVITNNNARELNLKADFLEKGKLYLATIYEDGPNGIVTKRIETIKQASIIKLKLQESGGAAMNIQLK